MLLLYITFYLLSNYLDGINNIMLKSWYNLNIDVSNSINKDWVFENNRYITFPKPDQIFDSNWLAYMKSLHLPINHAVVFYRIKNDDNLGDAHIDLDHKGESILCGLNWVYGGKGSKMIWYDLPDNFSIKDNIRSNEPGGKGGLFCSIPVTDSIKIDERVIDKSPVLVRVDMPHRVEMGSEPRWCVSARITTLPQDNWEDLIKYLLSKNLIS